MQHMHSVLQMKPSASGSPTSKSRKPRNYETPTSSAKARVVAQLGRDHQFSQKILHEMLE